MSLPVDRSRGYTLALAAPPLTSACKSRIAVICDSPSELAKWLIIEVGRTLNLISGTLRIATSVWSPLDPPE